MEQVRRELDELEAVVDEASHALIEADTRHAVAYVSRAARLLERRGSLIEAFGAITAKVEVSMEARKATVEALKLELQLKAEGLGSAHADTTAMNSAQAVFVAGNREAMDKASKGDLRYKPMLVLKFLASFAATTHDPRGTLWTTLLGVLGKVNIFLLKSNHRRLNAYHAKNRAAKESEIPTPAPVGPVVPVGVGAGVQGGVADEADARRLLDDADAREEDVERASVERLVRRHGPRDRGRGLDAEHQRVVGLGAREVVAALAGLGVSRRRARAGVVAAAARVAAVAAACEAPAELEADEAEARRVVLRDAEDRGLEPRARDGELRRAVPVAVEAPRHEVAEGLEEAAGRARGARREAAVSDDGVDGRPVRVLPRVLHGAQGPGHGAAQHRDDDRRGRRLVERVVPATL